MEKYGYNAIYTMHSLKALKHGSHSFTCKLQARPNLDNVP